MPRPRGAFRNLAAEPVVIGTAQPGWVEVEVKAVGINFRDVLNVLGMYPGDPGPPGGDCAGIVTCVPAGSTTALKPGDAVFGLAAGSLGSHVIASAKTVVPMPSFISFEEASSMPTVFITVDTAINQLAAATSADRVLVHAAAGGVGLAAMQVINASNAMPLTTAGSSNKRALLRLLGCANVSSSRDTAFVSELAEVGGASVVLNSLTSSGMVAGSLAALSAGGRFVEISKRDIWSPARVAQERPDVAYSLVAVDFMSEAALHAALSRVAAGVAAGSLRPLPQVAHNLADAQAALRQMGQARHVGKVVVRSPSMSAQNGGRKGSVVISGGLGTLGTQVAAWLAQHQVRHLHLLGRSGRSAPEGLQLEDPSAAAFAAAVTMVLCDAGCSEDAMGQAATAGGGQPVLGVMHAGGVLADGVLSSQSAATLRAVYAPKVDASTQLDKALGRQPGAFNLLFSSVAALLGSPGQANYSAANAALDAMAQRAQQAGAIATSVQWGAWAGAGMAAGDASTAARVERTGMALLLPQQGMAVMQGMLEPRQHASSAPPLLAANAFAWDTFMRRFGSAAAAPPFFAEFAGSSAPDGAAPAATSSGLAAARKGGAPGPGLSAADRKAAVLGQVQEAVGGILGADVSQDESLMAAGLDSLGAVELKNSLEGRLGLQLPGTLVFDYPTVSALAGFIETQLPAEEEGQEGAGAAADDQLVPLSPLARQPLDAALPAGGAIGLVGLSSRTAQNAVLSLVALDAISPMPLERWDVDALSLGAGVLPPRFGGFLEGVDAFDAGAFGLSGGEAELMDAQQRLLLEAALEATCHAGARLARPASVAVAVGIASAEYNNYIVPRFSTGVSAYSATGGALSVASGRLSYTFGFRGPAVSVDTACSSSLVAAHLAAGNVFAGVCSGGLTAGAGLLLSPDTTAMFHKAGMLAADGRCKTLAAAADGYVRGEAVGAVLMQALQGLQTGSLAVFVGSAANQDGRSSSLTAPNGPSQQEVVRQALAAARLAAADVAQLQMHGTGTPLGDPIEAGAAAAVLVDGARRALPLSAFTSKAWLGHTEAAAGVMGLTHSTAALSHRLAHGILHLTALNSHVSAILEMSAAKSAAPGWHLPRMATPVASGDGWTVCGTSSFAFQGTNAHALLRQADGLAATGPAVELATLNRQRVWLAPPVHAMLQAAAATGSARFARKRASAEVALEAALSTPCLAFLWQHTVLGMAVFPATAFLEMAAGATRQLLNSNDLSGSALRSAVFATPLTLPAAPAAAVRVRCTVQAAAGAFEVSSAAAAGAGQRSHFYASLTTAPANTPATAGQPCAAMPASHLALLPAQKGPLVARLAVAEAIVPPEQLGMSVHPAVSEAAMHVAVAHQSQPKQLRVASKMAAVAMHLVLSERSVWASSLVAGAGAGVRAAPGGGGLQEQQLLGVGGLAMRVSGMETRRLVSQRPAMMTPRMAASPHAAEDAPLSPFNLQTPHTPLYLLSPSADAAAYALGGGGGGLPSYHSSVEVLASRGATGAGLSPEALQSLVAEQVAAVLGSAVGPDDPLMAAGLDSLGATELQQGLADSLGLELPSTLVFDYPTVSALAGFLSARLAQGQLAAPGSALPSPAASSPSALARTAHHGAAGGAAAELLGAAGQHELRLARPGSDASSRVPYARWDADSPLITRDGTLPAQFGVFLPNPELFDAELFGVMRSEALSMDPQQRLLLHAAAQALPGDGAAWGRSVGAFVGIAATDYETLAHQHGAGISSFSFTAASPSVASGRLAYVYGLRGPAASVDTACSASLVAAHLACLTFRGGRVEGALAAGVLLCLVPESTLMLTRATMLSPEGRSKTLDASADGYARGEACRVLFLAPPGAARSARPALGLLLASAVNANGRASSLTAPNGPAQQALLREALAGGGVRAGDVAGLQMHSNGTALGDPIEAGAAAAILLDGARSQPRRAFLFATVKGSTGHQESGAGVAGLMAAAELVQAAAVPPALHLRHLNPHVYGALAGHQAAIARGGPNGVPNPRAGAVPVVGVSSFGAQGTNAHALLAGSGAAVTPSTWAAGEAPVWRRARCYVAPAAQQLLTSAVLLRKRGRGGSITLESRLSEARLAYLWQYSLLGRSFLASSALLGMAASLLPLLGAVAAGEDEGAAASSAAVVQAAMVAPAALPLAASARVAPAVARIKLTGASGAVEAAMGGQQLLTAALGLVPGASRPAASPGSSLVGAATRSLLPLLLQPYAREQAGKAAAACGIVADIGALAAADASGYALHPALLDACLGQAASLADPEATALPWLRTVAALVVGGGSPCGGVLAGAYAPANGWLAGSAGLEADGGAGPAATVLGAVLGEQDMPPMSPGPRAMPLSARAGGAGGGAEEAEEAGAGIPADHPLLQMDEEERLLHLQAQVMGEVRAMLGHAVHPDEPLMVAGLDSRGGMELRRSLADSLGLQLPVTLLYDYQSVSEVVQYISGALAAGAAAAAEPGAAAGSGSVDSDAEEVTPAAARQPRAGPVGADDKPSQLLKTLRLAPPERPLFLAAPGVANAQSAYFSFSQFLQWSSQPIYVLDKDNDLDVSGLAAVNAADIVRVQPQGPYLLGGHSYGGAVALEVAMVLESWGHTVGLVLIMDTPRPDQIRRAQPEAEAASEEDSLELMEMILGALGRDALGMGSSIAHPRESEEWKGMSMEQKFEFFAPIWRVMRDSNMSVEEVRQQVEYVALVTKQASSVSDLRRFAFSAPAISAPVVYFRAAAPGVCTYMDDRRDSAVPHGACWYDLCDDCEVIDVPGDHFSILRQDLGDMNLIVTALKQKLAPFGWSETLRRGGEQRGYAVSSAEMQDIDSYLQKMGVRDPALRRRLETAVPFADQAALAGGGAGGPRKAVAPLNSAAHEAAAGRGVHGAPVLLACCDAGGGLGGMEALLAGLELPVFAVCVPDEEAADDPADVAEAAMLALKAARGLVPAASPLLVGGVGHGAVLAHEMALQLAAAAPGAPLTLVLLEGCHSPRYPAALLSWLPPAQREEVCQVAAALYPVVAAAAGAAAPGVEAFAARLASLPGYDEQLDYVASFKPAEESQSRWGRRITDLLDRLAHWQALAGAYQATDIFSGPVLLLARPRAPGAAASLLAGGGPGGEWRSIASLVLPAELVELAEGAGGTVVRQVQAALLAAVRQAEEEEAAAPEEAAAEAGSSMAMTPRPPPYPAPPLPPPPDSDTASVVLPLNRLCPERRYILRRGGRSGTPRALLTPPLARLPLWLVHGETGAITGGLKEVAAALPLPVYGLAMGGAAAALSSLDELAAHYVAAVTAVQPHGPYLLAGCSVAGAAVAAAAAVRLQEAGQRVGLLLLDGCLGQPAGLPLHDATWYALYHLLCEIGTLRGPMGDFIDQVRAAGTPTQQLRLLNAYRPPELSGGAAADEAWDAAVYTTLDRATLLKRLLRGGRDSSQSASSASSPRSSATSRSSGGTSGSGGSGAGAFSGPVAALLPRDRLGGMMLDATRRQLRRGDVLHVPLGARHTECLLSPQGRQETAAALTDAVKALLPLL